MFGHQLRGVRVVLQHAGIFQLRPAETEIHRGFRRMRHEIRQIVARSKPGQNSVPFPTPGNDPLPRQIGRQMPIMLQGEFFYPPVQPVVIPSQRHQNTLLAFLH